MDLSKMTDSELRTLNKEICVEIRSRNRRKSMTAASQFSIGNEVSFIYKRQLKVGRIIRCNQKTASVKIEGEMTGYNVPWSMLSLATEIAREAFLTNRK